MGFVGGHFEVWVLFMTLADHPSDMRMNAHFRKEGVDFTRQCTSVTCCDVQGDTN